MDLDALLAECPDYAKDLKLNLSTLLRQSELNEQQLWGTAVAAAMAVRNARLAEAVLAEATKHLSPQALYAAKAAAAVMGMNNVYYSFLHLTSNQRYSAMPARLRMNVLRTHGVEAVDFELWCLAVSAINKCQPCVDNHEKAVRTAGISEEAVLAAIRLAAVIYALAAVYDTAGG